MITRTTKIERPSSPNISMSGYRTYSVSGSIRIDSPLSALPWRKNNGLLRRHSFLIFISFDSVEVRRSYYARHRRTSKMITASDIMSTIVAHPFCLSAKGRSVNTPRLKRRPCEDTIPNIARRNSTRSKQRANDHRAPALSLLSCAGIIGMVSRVAGWQSRL